MEVEKKKKTAWERVRRGFRYSLLCFILSEFENRKALLCI